MASLSHVDKYLSARASKVNHKDKYLSIGDKGRHDQAVTDFPLPAARLSPAAHASSTPS